LASVSADTSWSYAVDVYTAISEANFECIKNNGYSVAFIRIYTPDSGGSPDTNAVNNTLNALQAGLGVEVFVQPAPQSVKTGAKQYNDSMNNLRASNIISSQVWLLVTQPMIWSLDPSANVKFINSFMDQARANGSTVGIYTNWYDWYLITNQYMSVQTNGGVMLWYWHTLGIGSAAETDQDFTDYRQLGDWATPTVKQFGIAEAVCSSPVNRDVYVTPSSSASLTKASEHNMKLAKQMIAAKATGRSIGFGANPVGEGQMMIVGGHVVGSLSTGKIHKAEGSEPVEVFQWSKF
jgi:hypothetical protein